MGLNVITVFGKGKHFLALRKQNDFDIILCEFFFYFEDGQHYRLYVAHPFPPSLVYALSIQKNALSQATSSH